MAKLIASSSYTITDVLEKAIDRTEISFWHGLSATKRPLGVYDCSNRDHQYGNEFNVTSGKTYTVRVIAKQTKGSLSLRGGIWYTSMTSGNSWDGIANFTLVGEASEDGLGIYERKLVVASDKTKAKLYIQIEQSFQSGYTTAWRIYDGQVFDENGQPLVTDQNNYGALTSPMATPNGTYIWKRTITYYTDGTSNTIWEYNGVGPKGDKGDRGNDGIAGAPGVGIKSTTINYGVSANETTQPTTWKTTVPALIKGQYLWTKTVWTYTDNTNETGYSITYIAKDGNNGTNGIAGKDGVGIRSTVITYAASSSGTTVPTSGWTSAVPSVSPGQYLWTKNVWTYTDGTNETGYSVARMGSDGKTPYIHWAYSDNAGGTGLTFTDTGQRYIGHYSDYTQADSTDKTKYRWADRWAKIEVDGRNLAQKTSSEWSNPYTSFSGSTNTCPPLYKILVDDLAVGDTLKSRIVLKYTNIIPASGRTATIQLQGDGNITRWGAGRYNNSPSPIPISGSGEMVFEHEFKITADHLKNNYWNWMFRTDYIASGSLQWRLAKVEKGTVFTGWSPANEDVNDLIDTKADQALTLEQKRELEERMGIIESELKARALLAETDAWFEEYIKYKEGLATDKSASEKKLTDLSNRIDATVKDLGNMSVRWNFLDTYMKPGNEGLMIGKIDGSTSIRVSDNRIAFYSGGKEVAFISNNTLEIENGIFTTQLQVGRFQTSQYGPNPDANIVRYVG